MLAQVGDNFLVQGFLVYVVGKNPQWRVDQLFVKLGEGTLYGEGDGVGVLDCWFGWGGARRTVYEGGELQHDGINQCVGEQTGGMRAAVAIHDSEKDPVAGSVWVGWITGDDGLGMGVFEGVVRGDGRGAILPGHTARTGDCL